MKQSDLRIKFYKNDPLLKLFVDKLHLNWLRMMGAYFILWVGEIVFYIDTYGVPRNTNTIINGIGIVFWSGSVLFAYYVWSSQAFPSLVWKLCQSGSFQFTPKEHNSSTKDYIWGIDYLENLWNKKIWTIGAVLATIIIWWWAGWWHSFFSYYGFPLYEKYFAIKMFFVQYVAIRVFTLEMLSLFSLSKLAKWDDFTYQAFHPDNAGGLSEIGRYRLGFIYFVFGMIFYFLFWIIAKPTDPLILLQLITVIVLIPLSFFLGIFPVHVFMRKVKEKMLLPITKELDSISHINVQADISYPSDRLDTLNLLLEKISHAPEWPFNMSILRNLFGTWMSFIIALLLAVFSELIKGWITQ